MVSLSSIFSKTQELIKKYSYVEWFILIIFAVYIVVPLSTPPQVADLINSSAGIIILIAITLFLFIYCCPCIGAVFVIVAYLLIVRSSKMSPITQMKSTTPTQKEKDAHFERLNPIQPITLEEMVVEERAPLGKSNIVEYISNSTYKPVFDTIDGVAKYA